MHITQRHLQYISFLSLWWWFSSFFQIVALKIHTYTHTNREEEKITGQKCVPRKWPVPVQCPYTMTVSNNSIQPDFVCNILLKAKCLLDSNKANAGVELWCVSAVGCWQTKINCFSFCFVAYSIICDILLCSIPGVCVCVCLSIIFYSELLNCLHLCDGHSASIQREYMCAMRDIYYDTHTLSHTMWLETRSMSVEKKILKKQNRKKEI